MAEAQAKKPVDSRDQAAPSSSNKAKKTNDWVGFALLGLAAVNVVVLGAMGYFMQKLWTRMHDVQQSAHHAPVAAEESTPATQPVGKELQPQNLGALYPLEGFLVNINSEQGSKFLQVQMELELSDPSLEDEISRKKAAVRDAIIVLMSSRTYTQLKAPNGMQNLRKDLLTAINHLLSGGKVKDIYYTQFHFN